MPKLEDSNDLNGFILDESGLPENFPTHLHSPRFWEELGRAIATFGFLEEVLGKAIFSFTATRRYSDEEIDKALRSWLPKLERALSDPLGSLIDAYGKAVREHSDADIENFDQLLDELRKIAVYRNILCHSSWRCPDANGASVPYFFKKEAKKFDGKMDIEFLGECRNCTVNLICEVINTVTCMGWQFPGSVGPGVPIYDK